MAIEYLQVKSMDDYLNEASVTEIGSGQTYDEGFKEAFNKLVGIMQGELMDADEDDEEEGGGGPDMGGGLQLPKFESELDNNDLEKIKLPPKKGKKKQQDGDDDGLPENIEQQEDEQNGSDNSDMKDRGESGDQNNLADDLEKKSQNGSKQTSQDFEFGGNDDNSIGKTGSFIEDGLSEEELREAGYDGQALDDVKKVIDDNVSKNSKEKIEKAKDELVRELPAYSPIKKYLDAIEISSEKYKNVWKKILEQFLSQRTRRAGSETATGHNDWVRKKSIAKGEYGIHRQKEAKDPQDVNFYVDVSGSVDMELLEIIAKSLVVFTKTWKYSGLNICPWASRSNGVYHIDDFYRKSEAEITTQILDIISKGESQCGGGTNIDAALDAMIDCVEATLLDQKKKRKDDVHIIITDGWFNYNGVENKIKQRIKRSTDRDDVAEKAPEHTFWMIYDMKDDASRKSWQDEIKEGKIIFINTEVVKNNK